MTSSAIQSIIDSLEGSPMVFHQRKNDKIRCDSCSDTIPPNNQMAIWITGHDMDGNAHNGMMIYRLHCDDCTPQPSYYKQTQLSPKGWLEIVLTGHTDSDLHLRDLDLHTYSLPAEGIDYDPKQVVRTAFGVPPKAVETLDGPQDVIDILMYASIDPREFITEDGIPDLTDEEQMANAEQMFERFQQEGSPERVRNWWARYGDEVNTSVDIADSGV